MTGLTVHSAARINRTITPMTLEQAKKLAEHKAHTAKEEGVVFIVWHEGIPEEAVVSPGGGSEEWGGGLAE